MVVAAAIAIVGAGPVGQAFGRLLRLRGLPIVSLASRTRARAERAAAFVGGGVRAVALDEVPGTAERVLVAVADDGIAPVAEALARAGMRQGVALHTCGARDSGVLAPLAAHGIACGVIHPLQTLMSPEQGVRALPGITFGLTGDRLALDWAGEIVTALEGHPLFLAAEQLGSYHAGAVMGSNALIAAIDTAVLLMARAGISADDALRALEPLARASLDNALERGPRAAATGPVVRGDATTVAMHLAALGGAPRSVEALYRAVAERLREIARERGLPEAQMRALESVLDG